MNELTDLELKDIDDRIIKYMSKGEIQSKISELYNEKKTRLSLNIDNIRKEDPYLVRQLLTHPLKLIPIFERCLKDTIKDIKGEKLAAQDTSIMNQKQSDYRVTFEGNIGKNMVSPRGLNSTLTNQFVGVQGIVTRVSLVRPKLVYSTHYCENTKQGSVKEYTDQMSLNSNTDLNNTGINTSIQGKANGFLSNTVPVKDVNNNPLSMEYGYSKFKDHQVILIQEPPERTPVGQLPRSIEVILEEDLVDKIKPGDRVEALGVFKCISSLSTNYSGIVRTVLIATNITKMNQEIDKPSFSGDDLKNINNLANKKNIFDILANSISPGIFGHQYIKKALILQLLGGSEKNLEDGTHLRGDINILMIGDPSTAKSQFLRHMLSIAPNAINTTGRGSSGVGLTAAVVVDKDTGDRHLEAGAMVLGDRGVVCIDEFDKMSEVDRVAIHEVMEQQTVTIAKAGIHVSLNARCSVLAAANPIYGKYIPELPPARNIGFPDSLLSRFDLCFVVLDEHTSEKDKLISERVINNHMFTVDNPSIVNNDDDNVIEPEIHGKVQQKTQTFEKYNPYLHGKDKKNCPQILTRDFLRKYLYYAKNKGEPVLTDESSKFISDSWTRLRAKSADDNDFSQKYKVVPITVRTLETLIRLSTAHAKLRLSNTVDKIDCIEALQLLIYALYNETEEDKEYEEEEEDNKMDIDEEEEIMPKKTKSKKTKKNKNEPEQSTSKKKPKKKAEEPNDKEEVNVVIE